MISLVSIKGTCDLCKSEGNFGGTFGLCKKCSDHLRYLIKKIKESKEDIKVLKEEVLLHNFKFNLDTTLLSKEVVVKLDESIKYYIYETIKVEIKKALEEFKYKITLNVD